MGLVLHRATERQRAVQTDLRTLESLEVCHGGKTGRQGKAGQEPQRNWWMTVAPYLESLLCVFAVAGLAVSLAGDFQRARTFDYVATDYKTLYASAALFRHGANPYSVLYEG